MELTPAQLTIEYGTHPTTGATLVSMTIPGKTDRDRPRFLLLTINEARDLASALERVAAEAAKPEVPTPYRQ